MQVSDKWKEMVTASERVIEDFNDFADDRATVWADKQIKQLTEENARLRAALEYYADNSHNVFPSVAREALKGLAT